MAGGAVFKLGSFGNFAFLWVATSVTLDPYF
jgi:hypothetical protein